MIIDGMSSSHQVTGKLTDPKRHDLSVQDYLQDGPQTLYPLCALLYLCFG